MLTKDLNKILEEIPILLWNRIVWKKGNDYYEAEAIAVSRKKNNQKYTIMNYNCDHLAETLLHESLHHHCPTCSEEIVGELTEFYWKGEYKKVCRSKIIERLGNYNL